MAGGRITWRFAALTVWPGVPTPRASRKRAPFKSTYQKTIAHLERELGHLGARDVLLEADCDPSQVRMDGQLRASARMRGPGVIITCRVGKDTYRFPCDRFSEWQDNARAISLTLERMRAVDRYGVTLNREQYAGFKALPESAAVPDSRDAAIAVLERFSGESGGPHGSVDLTRMLRAARFRTHTDRGGRRQDWDAVEAAARVLGVL